MTDEAIARREAEAAFESWPRSQGINESVAAWGRRAFLAGSLSRQERIEALEAALRPFAEAGVLTPKDRQDSQVVAIVPGGHNADRFAKMEKFLTAANFRAAAKALPSQIETQEQGA